jgi:UDP-glucose 4-epimerase
MGEYSAGAGSPTPVAGGAFAGARVLVTGGLGFIGSRLAIRLSEVGARVTILDNLAPESGANRFNVAPLGDRARIHVGDIRDADAVAGLVRGQDFLMNCAALVAHRDSMRSPLEDLDVNARAQLTLLDACRAGNPGVRIVHASTRQVYGRPDRLPVAEDHPARPVDVNGVNKLAGELFFQLYHRVYGVRASVLRLTNTFGPGMRVRDGRLTFIGVWLRALVEGSPIEVWGGEQRRDFTYVDDVVDAFCAAALSEAAVGEVYNVGGAEPLTLRQLAELLIEVHGGGRYAIIPYPEEFRTIEIGDFVSDSRKIAGALGWAPRVPLREGLARTLRYYTEHLKHYL